MPEIIQMEKQRKIYLDVVRIFAIYLVLFTHTTDKGHAIYYLTDNTTEQFFYCILDSFRTVNNSLLFMVSGALLLGKDEELKTIWSKRVLRFVEVLLIFSFIQFAYSCLESHLNFFDEFSLTGFIKSVVEEPMRFSYWYLYTYIAFLIMLPFIRKLAKIKGSLMLYLTIALIIVQDVFPLLKYIFGLSKINLSLGTWILVPFYPICGYYLDNNWDRLKYKNVYWIILGVLSVLGLCISAYLTVKHHTESGVWDENSLGYLDIAKTLFWFVTLKELSGFIKNDRTKFLLELLSSTVFGVYLLENIIKNMTVIIFYILEGVMPRIIACNIWLIITMLVGCMIVYLLKRIPLLKKLI